MSQASTTAQVADTRYFGQGAAYAAFVLAIAGIPAITESGTRCVDDNGALTEPGEAVALLSVMLAPLLAIAALVLLRLARRSDGRRSPGAVTAAVLVFPLAVVDLFLYTVKTLFVCPGSIVF